MEQAVATMQPRGQSKYYRSINLATLLDMQINGGPRQEKQGQAARRRLKISLSSFRVITERIGAFA